MTAQWSSDFAFLITNWLRNTYCITHIPEISSSTFADLMTTDDLDLIRGGQRLRRILYDAQTHTGPSAPTAFNRRRAGSLKIPHPPRLLGAVQRNKTGLKSSPKVIRKHASEILAYVKLRSPEATKVILSSRIYPQTSALNKTPACHQGKPTLMSMFLASVRAKVSDIMKIQVAVVGNTFTKTTLN